MSVHVKIRCSLLPQHRDPNCLFGPTLSQIATPIETRQFDLLYLSDESNKTGVYTYFLERIRDTFDPTLIFSPTGEPFTFKTYWLDEKSNIFIRFSTDREFLDAIDTQLRYIEAADRSPYQGGTGNGGECVLNFYFVKRKDDIGVRMPSPCQMQIDPNVIKSEPIDEDREVMKSNNSENRQLGYDNENNNNIPIFACTIKIVLEYLKCKNV